MSRKLCCLTLFVCMSLAGSAMILQSLDQPKLMLRAEGTAPVPPWPTGSTLPDLLLRAEGGMPVPPWPSGSTPPDLLLRADGGSPVPPWPGGDLAA